ncbi:alpha/beta fold hydrolase [Hydrogenophaga sp. A37]|uniref:alpha/beta fold hydrolase n=1 Tax=Hydrogenophaga sp. A37 TaxID=1945864 RepID=UPI0009846C74|nr:alpha/beta hydrolase [Hydrogenophaga sp. A37]OOG82619.1 alpha/beta hydrolase [Hydrogenophaga sp. A37]
MNTWIFLRGLTREAAHWGRFTADFKQALPRARIHTLDLPGNGEHHRQTSPLSVADMVTACRMECARRDIETPVYLLAMSLGAMVAAEWARVAPEELKGCVLINTSMRPFSPLPQRLRPANYPALLGLTLRGGSPEAIEQTVLRLTSNQPGELREVIPDWSAVRRLRPVSAGNAMRQLLAAARYRAPRQAPGVPMLLLSSEHDQLVDSRCSQAIASAWHCPLRTHPAAGHDLPLDDPRWVTGQVCAWLRRGHG